MRNHKSVLSLLGVLTLIVMLAACSPDTSITGTPGTFEPGTLPTISGTEATQSLTAEPTGSAMGSEIPEATSGTPEGTNGTPEATIESTQAVTATVEETQNPSGTQIIPPTGAVDAGRLSNLMGFSVVSSDNQQLGTVDDLIINLEKLQVDYVVVKNADKDIPVPWKVLSLNGGASGNATTAPSKNAFTLMVDQSAFTNAPTFDLTTLPALGEPAGTWDADIQTYWQNFQGTSATEMPTPAMTDTPATTATPSASMQAGLQGVMRASDLLGYKLQFGDNQASLAVNDVIVDTESGAVEYVVISFTSTGAGEKLIPIPLSLFSWDSTNMTFTLTADPQIVANAPSFQSGEYPATRTSGWDADIHAYWQDKTGQ